MNSSAFYSIPAEEPFLARLAGWILGEFSRESLPQLLLLLPTRRACRSMQEAFLAVGGGVPMLLPRIRPIGDIEETDFLLYGGLAGDLPAAISPLRRQLLLTNLVMEFEKDRQQGASDIAQASQLARQLAQFLDEVARENASLDNLQKLVPQELAGHWQQTLDFLTIISRHWPPLLEEEGVIEPIDHRNRLLLAMAAALRKNPPPHPVIVAGSTGSQPATAALLASVATLPQGRIVLPGLDYAMAESQWNALEETHPQYALKALLERLDVPRSKVQQVDEDASARMACLKTVFQSPEATSEWRNQKLPLEGLDGVSLIEAESLLDEARMIAIALREVLEQPGKTAALITPDRTLARMVAAQMQRFNIAIDDSAGHRLADSPSGTFLRLTAELAASDSSPAAFLALLRHPLAACGLSAAECRLLSRELEIKLLRGVRTSDGVAGLLAAAKRLKEKSPEMVALLEGLKAATEPFLHACQGANKPLRVLMEAHLAFAEFMASTPEQTGADRLWAGESGAKLSEFLAELMQQSAALSSVEPRSYAGLFGSLIADKVFRPAYGQHPRLHILSPMEARLQHFDRAILGGLNEGSWPQLPGADPWMSRPMRGEFGLAALERAIGQSAFDFYLLSASPEVMLTRSRKSAGVPQVPSRWLVRLTTLLQGLAPETLAALSATERYEDAKSWLERPSSIEPLEYPSFTAPLEARPRELSVTAVETGMKNPYMLYARHVLKLKALEALDREPGAADFGNIVHEALKTFLHAHPKELPENAVMELLAAGRQAFRTYIDRPSVACIWWPRFEAMASWLIAREKERRPFMQSLYAELSGQWLIEREGGAFTLTTRIDRMEVAKNGEVTLIDYKTGSAPKDKDMREGKANQLFFEALIASQSLIPDGAGRITSLDYWILAGSEERFATQEFPLAQNADALEKARAKLMAWIDHYQNPDTAYEAQRNPALLPRYNDYEHLTRRKEWQDV